VTAIDAEGVEAGGARIRARTVFWAAGVQGARLARTLGVTLDRTGRIAVMPDLSIPGAPDAFAAGDIVHLEVPGGGLVPGRPRPRSRPAVRPPRVSSSRCREGHEWRSTTGDKRLMATIGKHKAVAKPEGSPSPATLPGSRGYSCTCFIWRDSGIGCPCSLNGAGAKCFPSATLDSSPSVTLPEASEFMPHLLP
jgi:hypothetical protein